MSKLLDQAIEQLRELPEDEQDAAADAVIAYIASEERHYHLLPDHVEKVRLEKVRRSRTELEKGTRSLDHGEGRELHINDVIKRARAQYGKA